MSSVQATVAQYAHTEEAKYIIGVNEKLSEENKELRAQLAEKDSENSELESDLGQRETQVRYMRGLLKNFVEIDNLRKDINKKSNNLSIDQVTILTRIYKYNKSYNYYDYINCIITLFLICSSLIVDGVTCYILPLIWTIDYSLKKWRSISLESLEQIKIRTENIKNENKREIKSKKDEVNAIIKGCDFLNEYIDNI
jgi:hypothetical protein